MRHPALAEDLVPINEFRANVASWLARVEETKRPVVVTQRGRAAGVLVAPEVLDQLEVEIDLVRVVLRGLNESADQDLIDAEDLWAEVDALTLKR